MEWADVEDSFKDDSTQSDAQLYVVAKPIVIIISALSILLIQLMFYCFVIKSECSMKLRVARWRYLPIMSAELAISRRAFVAPWSLSLAGIHLVGLQCDVHARAGRCRGISGTPSIAATTSSWAMFLSATSERREGGR